MMKSLLPRFLVGCTLIWVAACSSTKQLTSEPALNTPVVVSHSPVPQVSPEEIHFETKAEKENREAKELEEKFQRIKDRLKDANARIDAEANFARKCIALKEIEQYGGEQAPSECK